MRTKLTNAEWNAVSHLTSATKMDDSFDIDFGADHDYFNDFENNCEITLKEGFELILDGLTYPCLHDGLTLEEGKLIVKVMKEFADASDKWCEWYLSTAEE